MEFVPFHPSHVGQMALREWDKKFLSMSPEMSQASADIFMRNGVAFTGVAQEGIVGAGGIVKILPGNYELWVYTTDLFPKYAVSIHRFALRYVNEFFRQSFVRRLQILVDEYNNSAFDWAARLLAPYQLTGLPKYGPEGQMFFMFAKIK